MVFDTSPLDDDINKANSNDEQPRNGPNSFPNSSSAWLSRSYHSVEGSAYVLPVDDIEFDRISSCHHLIKKSFFRNVLAPTHEILERGGTVLDIGCSEGTWCFEVAAEYPNAKIYGIDMLPVYPQDCSIIPPNLHFSVVNILQGPLPWPDDFFDYVHMRMIVLGLRAAEWGPVLKECQRITKKNGWIETFEPDYEVWMAGPIFKEFLSNFNNALILRGLDPFFARNLFSALTKTGFVDVEHNFRSVRVGEWGGKLGMKQLENVSELIMGLKKYLVDVWKISSEDFDKWSEAAITELKSSQAYINYHSAFGRKPDLLIEGIHGLKLR